LAGSETTASTLQTIMIHFADNPKDQERIRDEFNSAKENLIKQDAKAFENLTSTQIY
jgi:cytochrome P450